jgi:thiamine kinase-like enzyme
MPPSPDRQEQARLIRRLRRLDLARGPLDVEPIPGGITNHNFAVRVRNGGATYVARLCEDRAILGVDRRNEVVCHQAASDRGVAPELVHHEPGLLVTRFIDARTLDAAGVREPATLTRLAALLRRLHESWDVITGEVLHFCPFQSARTYARAAARLGASLPAGIDALLEDARALSHQIAPFRPSPCHNDLLPANILDDGRRLWLVDWEYAGIGHPLFDLANLAANAELDDDGERHLLAAYCGTADPRELAELQIYRAASTLREALWGTIQTLASAIDFDYQGYADRYFHAYRKALARLDVSL